MKKCPFCAEEIQDAAIKCKHCGEFLDKSFPQSQGEKNLPWYFRTSFILLVFCAVGPLVLPLIWWRPKTSLAWKICWTALILVVSWLLLQVMLVSLESLKEYYRLLDSL